ncbi:unnamed protein product [Haemonchus placei]|uniref:Uncharacterized protein n=1 Tax=Haemonchus placei TaxID=6290 RepID=A0A0N4X5Y1_HAEPC|nr:unnamed protein product [Haemonchus placei]
MKHISLIYCYSFKFCLDNEAILLISGSGCSPKLEHNNKEQIIGISFYCKKLLRDKNMAIQRKLKWTTQTIHRVFSPIDETLFEVFSRFCFIFFVNLIHFF